MNCPHVGCLTDMLKDMAHEDYFHRHALALAHHISAQELRRRGIAEYTALPPFSFPKLGSPGALSGRPPGSQLIKVLYLKEFEDGKDDFLRRRQQLIDGEGILLAIWTSTGGAIVAVTTCALLIHRKKSLVSKHMQEKAHGAESEQASAC